MFDVMLRVELVSDTEPLKSEFVEHPFKMAVPPAVGMCIDLPGEPEGWNGSWSGVIGRVWITADGAALVYVGDDSHCWMELSEFKESVADLVAAGWKVYTR